MFSVHAAYFSAGLVRHHRSRREGPVMTLPVAVSIGWWALFAFFGCVAGGFVGIVAGLSVARYRHKQPVSKRSKL